ncbi:MAG: radical SAM protein [Candidatus Firestonebacteria bacterium]
MNITLIRPPAYSVGLMGAQLVPFLGILYISAVAKKNGHNVDIIDMCGEDINHTEIVHGKYVAYGMPFSKLNERLKKSDVIGFTCTFSQDWVFNKELIQYVRKLYPASIFVAGGEHISALPEYCLEDCPELNICVAGEGEEVFVKLLDVLEKKGDLSEVPSLTYRESNSKTICNTPRGNRIRNIDEIPLPSWDLIPLENYLSKGLNYHIKRGRTIPMLATRGCPYNCTFCSNSNMWGNLWFARDAKLVVDEMEYYIKHYNANNFVFSDLTAVVNKKSIIDLCNEILARKINITFQLPTLRTEALDYSVLKLMFDAGCRELDFAIESASKEVLKSVNKKNDPGKIVQLMRDGLNIGINLSTNIIIGLPKEGWKELLTTYFLVIKLAFVGLQEVNIFPFIPYPGSKLFKDFLENKKIELNDDYFLNLFAYADLARAISWSENFSPKVLSFMRIFLMANFYCFMFILHPKRIVKLILNTIKGTPATKLEGVVSRVIKNIKISSFSRKRESI